MKRIKLILIISFFMSFIIITEGQTYVSGGIHNDVSWTPEDSPYIVIGDMAIFPNVTLTVESGTTIKFDSSKVFYVRGNLYLNGTQDEKITITSNLENPQKGDWKGFIINNDQGGNIIGTHIDGKYAEIFIEIKSSSSNQPIHLTNSKISYCEFAIYGYYAPSYYSIVLDSDSITFNTYAIRYGQNLTVSNCVFSNGLTGIHNWEYNLNTIIYKSEFYNLTDYPLNIMGVIDSCHIHHNAVGIRMKPIIDVHDCTIEYNDIGIKCTYSGVPISGESIYNNIIMNNTLYNFEHHEEYPINIPYNCWGSDNEEDIGLTIYDGYDDVSLGIVTFTPFNTDCVQTNTIETKPDQFFLYPNPANNYLYLNSDKNMCFSIFTIYGEKVLVGKTDKIIDISTLKSGYYIIKSSDFDSKVINNVFIKN